LKWRKEAAKGPIEVMRELLIKDPEFYRKASVYKIYEMLFA